MGIYCDRGRWYFVKRVPKRFAHVDKRQRVSRALHTDSESEAKTKAPFVEAELMAYWEALAAGQAEDAARRYEAAKQLAHARGFSYRPSAELLQPTAATELSARLSALASPGHVAPWPEVEAMLGLAETPSLTFTAAASEFFRLTKDRVAGKSERQAHLWRTARERAVANFVDVIGDKALPEITRADAIRFRTWWQDKVTEKKLRPGTANKEFGHLSDVFRTVDELLGLDLENPFAGMRLKVNEKAKVPPFSLNWIKTKLLAPGALDGLNQEARDVLLIMINTGARPSEIIDAAVEDFAVAANIPHLIITPRDGRTLKTLTSERIIPLAGVSLEAARRLKDAGGCIHYAQRTNAWSATTNKFLKENGLRESDSHTAYSLRHAFEDRLLEAGVDERLRVELMGHAYKRPAYGRGGSLETKASAIALISI